MKNFIATIIVFSTCFCSLSLNAQDVSTLSKEEFDTYYQTIVSRIGTYMNEQNCVSAVPAIEDTLYNVITQYAGKNNIYYAAALMLDGLAQTMCNEDYDKSLSILDESKAILKDLLKNSSDKEEKAELKELQSNVNSLYKGLKLAKMFD